MSVEYIEKSLLDMEGYLLVQAGSADLKMHNPVAQEINKTFPFYISVLDDCYPNFEQTYENNDIVGTVLSLGCVATLITKTKWDEQSSFEAIYNSLLLLREECKKENILNIAMPKLWSGKGGIPWQIIEDMILEIFENSPIEVMICVPDEKTLELFELVDVVYVDDINWFNDKPEDIIQNRKSFIRFFNLNTTPKFK